MILCCPSCGVHLRSEQSILICTRCAYTWPKRDGIPSFRGEASETPDPEVQILLDDIGRRGWDEAIDRGLAGADRDRYRDIYDPRLLDWFYLADIEGRETALALGLDLGGLPMRLARLFDHVTAVDAAWEQIEFARILFDHEGLSNVTLIHAGIAEIPLLPESFDLVVIGKWFEQQCDLESQKRVLDKTQSLLRPGGTLCLAAVNSCALKRLGRRKSGGPRHTATGYARLLTAAGLTNIEGFAAFPSYLHPRVLVPLADPSKLCWATELSLVRRIKKLSYASRLAHRISGARVLARLACSLSESFIFFSRRPPVPQAGDLRPSDGSLPAQLRNRIIAEWTGLGLGGVPSSISVTQFSGNWDRGGKVNWFVFPGRSDRPALIAKIARTSADSDRVQNEHAILTWLRSLGPAVEIHVPRPLALWDIAGHRIAIEGAAPLQPLTARLSAKSGEAAVESALRLCLPFITALALHTRRDLPNRAPHPYIGALVESASAALSEPRYPTETRELFTELAHIAQEGQEAGCVPFTVTHHGDMSAGDLLVSRGRQPLRAGEPGLQTLCVIDWEWSVREGLPFADLVYVALSTASLSGPDVIASAMRSLVGDSEPAISYCDRVGLPHAARRPLAAAALLNLMLRMPDSKMSVLQITLPSGSVPVIAAARALLCDTA